MGYLSISIRLYLCILMLSLIVPVISSALTLDVSYKIDEGHFDYCDKEAKYLLTVYIKNSLNNFRALVSAYFLDPQGKAINPCFPEYHTRVVDVKTKSVSTTKFYFKDLPEVATLYISVKQWGGESKLYTFQFSKAKTTLATTTTLPSNEPVSKNPITSILTSILTIIDSHLVPFYNSYIPETIPYSYFSHSHSSCSIPCSNC